MKALDLRSGAIKEKDIKDLPVSEALKGIPEELKTAEKFREVEKAISKIMFSDHKHKTMKAFVRCKRCQKKTLKKREYIKGVGFKDYQQYLRWKQVFQVIYEEITKDRDKSSQGAKI